MSLASGPGSNLIGARRLLRCEKIEVSVTKQISGFMVWGLVVCNGCVLVASQIKLGRSMKTKQELPQ
jgi:hypothetical protein